MLTQLILLIIASVAVWQGLRSYRSWKERRRIEEYREWKAAQQYTILKILVPKNNEKTPLAAEQMFAALHGIYRDGTSLQDQVSFELAAYEKFIHFYVHVPRHLKEFVEGQIYAQYPTVEITEAEDYTALRPTDQVTFAAELALTKDDVYPIKTFQNFTVDPLSGITAVLGNLGPGEQLWVQFIVKPVAEDWQERGIAYVTAKRSGMSTTSTHWFPRLMSSIGAATVAFIRTALQPAAPAGEGGGDGEEKSRVQLSAPEEAALKGIEEKVTKLGFSTKIRFVSCARDSYMARSRIEALTGAFKQFNTTNLNGFRIANISDSPDALGAFVSRDFQDGGATLNTEEIASLYHLPAATVETPNIAWAGSKKGEPPANLPLEGVADENELTFFGVTDFRSFRHKFGIKSLDRRLHMYSIGKTGTGKSTLLQNMVLDDIKKGKGVAVVDPHGQLVQDILQRLPSHRLNDVIYFNPADHEYPVGFNLFENVNPDLRSVVASGIVSIFKKLFAESWGPRLEYILRNAILALLYYPDTTLLGVNRLLVDDEYRRRVVRKVADPVVRAFFEEEYNLYDPKFRREAISSIQNKVGQFLSSPTIRNILGQPRSSFDMRKVMDDGKIILMDLSIGRIGEDNAALLGAMLITKIQLAAMSRADVSESDRPDFYLYVDEFQNFATDSFAVILSEARKYHLNLTLTNQYIAQMPETVAKAIFGNVGTIVSFRVGSGDASGLAAEFAPVFEPQDLINLGNHSIYVKMAIDGVTRPAFSATTLPPQDVSTSQENYDKVVRISRERYAKPRDFVEQKIQEWADDVQVKQAQEWRRKVQEKEGVGPDTQGGGVAPTQSAQTRPGAAGREQRVGGQFRDVRDQRSGGGGGQPNRSRSPERSERGSGPRRNDRPRPQSLAPRRDNRPAPARQPGRQGGGERPSRPSQSPRHQPPEQGRGSAPQQQSPRPPQPPKALISDEDIAALRNDQEQRGSGTDSKSHDGLQSLDEL